MKKLILIFLLTTLVFQAPAQKTIYDFFKICLGDSILLNNTWISFYQGVLNKDTNKIRELSYEIVYCPLCVRNDSFIYERNFIPIDTFIKITFSGAVFDSHLYNVIKNKKYRLRARRIPGYTHPNVKLDPGEPYEDYEMFYVTREADEWGKGHEGQSYYFTFVKINGQFKFIGTGTIP